MTRTMSAAVNGHHDAHARAESIDGITACDPGDHSEP